MSQSLENKFLSALEKDRVRFIKKWLVSWDYQETRKKRGVKYDDSLPADFFRYNGPEDLVKWMNWFQSDYKDYLPSSLVDPLIKRSRTNDEKILNSLGLNTDWSAYDKRVGLNNAHDFIFPQLYPAPDRYKIRNVIDFGAGYGRQANLWACHIEGMFVGIDAIPNSYCLQQVYYKALGLPFSDYMDAPDNFSIPKTGKGIFHIPTWRTDLLPENTFDLVMCVQVLPELNSTLVSHMFDVFQRVLKPGGILYIRDHTYTWKPAGKLDTESVLADKGFSLEFKAHIINDKDLHGVPRIWRKNDPEVIRSVTMTAEAKKKQLLEDADALSGGLLRKLKKKIS